MRTVGASDEVARKIAQSQTAFDHVFCGLFVEDAGLRMRCADAIEKASRFMPELLESHKNEILNVISKINQQEVQWHVALIVPRLRLSKDEASLALKIMQSYYDNSQSNIVRTFALQTMYDLSLIEPKLSTVVTEYVKHALSSKAPSIRNRAKKLAAKLR